MKAFITASLLAIALTSVAAESKNSALPDFSKTPTAELEKMFWDCDYASTQTLLGFDEAAVCSAVFEEVKKRKFDGNFSDQMKWWRANKTKEYAARAKK